MIRPACCIASCRPLLVETIVTSLPRSPRDTTAFWKRTQAPLCPHEGNNCRDASGSDLTPTGEGCRFFNVCYFHGRPSHPWCGLNRLSFAAWGRRAPGPDDYGLYVYPVTHWNGACTTAKCILSRAPWGGQHAPWGIVNVAAARASDIKRPLLIKPGAIPSWASRTYEALKKQGSGGVATNDLVASPQY